MQSSVPSWENLHKRSPCNSDDGLEAVVFGAASPLPQIRITNLEEDERYVAIRERSRSAAQGGLSPSLSRRPRPGISPQRPGKRLTVPDLLLSRRKSAPDPGKNLLLARIVSKSNSIGSLLQCKAEDNNIAPLRSILKSTTSRNELRVSSPKEEDQLPRSRLNKVVFVTDVNDSNSDSSSVSFPEVRSPYSPTYRDPSPEFQFTINKMAEMEVDNGEPSARPTTDTRVELQQRRASLPMMFTSADDKDDTILGCISSYKRRGDDQRKSNVERRLTKRESNKERTQTEPYDKASVSGRMSNNSKLSAYFGHGGWEGRSPELSQSMTLSSGSRLGLSLHDTKRRCSADPDLLQELYVKPTTSGKMNSIQHSTRNHDVVVPLSHFMTTVQGRPAVMTERPSVIRTERPSAIRTERPSAIRTERPSAGVRPTTCIQRLETTTTEEKVMRIKSAGVPKNSEGRLERRRSLSCISGQLQSMLAASNNNMSTAERLEVEKLRNMIPSYQT